MNATLAKDETYTSVMVLERVGITFRMLDYWVRSGLLNAVDPPAGSGTQRRYAPDEVRLVFVLNQLRDLGLQGTPLRACVDQLRTLLHNAPSDGYVVVKALTGNRRLATDPEIELAFVDGQSVMPIVAPTYVVSAPSVNTFVLKEETE